MNDNTRSSTKRKVVKSINKSRKESRINHKYITIIFSLLNKNKKEQNIIESQNLRDIQNAYRFK